MGTPTFGFPLRPRKRTEIRPAIKKGKASHCHPRPLDSDEESFRDSKHYASGIKNGASAGLLVSEHA